MSTVFIKIYGKVQGVFFRANAQGKALELGLTGWVKNEPDGTVLIEAQGEKDKLEKFIQLCRKGSSNSQVGKMEIQWLKISNEKYKDFKIIK